MKTWTLLISILITCYSYSQSRPISTFESELNPNGIVFPRMTTSERDNLQAEIGQCIYNTFTSEINCFDGIQWRTASHR